MRLDQFPRLKTHLPLVHFILLRLVLLQQVVQDLLQAFRIRLERRHNLLDCPLHQNAIDHAEALPLAGEGLQSLKHEPVVQNERAAEADGGERR